ncbi:unnamed protein product [Brassica rapa]|uniref:Uncharacterized protein n=2 Tax=Brassica TaxID=3705 RepID=A0A8D9M8S7_BRACM|nr:unnamed protein product [Brassica napus]CAG7902768.1 unnamed protein product [Brassica rapa]
MTTILTTQTKTRKINQRKSVGREKANHNEIFFKDGVFNPSHLRSRRDHHGNNGCCV